MPVTTLTASNGFSAGADLWIAPSIGSSKLSQKLDWYLNFQVYKSLHRKPAPLAKELTSIMSLCNIEEYSYKPQPSSTLLIASHNLLPNRWTLLIEEDDFNRWIKIIFSQWESLKRPSLRVFLPTGKSSADFTSSWMKVSPFEDFSIVSENN